jgi:hypothetical protein
VIRTSDELRRYALTNVSGPVAVDEFHAAFSDLLARAPEGLVRHHAFFFVPVAGATWLDTGIDLLAGDALTLFATARPRSSSEPEVRAGLDPREFQRAATEDIEARRGVWYRVGTNGPPMRGTRASYTFVAPSPGRLFLAAAPIEGSAAGSNTPQERPLFELPGVDRFALVLVWAGDPREGVQMLRAGGEVGGLLRCEIARQQAVIELPDGWLYAPDGADGEQFAADGREAGGPIIGCYSNSSGVLLKKDAVLPFLPGTTLRWTWRVSQLPSTVREDRLPTHNYLSIAVEFDNGRDLTYYWSSELPVETAYACPVPGWEHRETHIVVRSGPDGLAQWLDEERDVHADYSRYMGDPPAGIVRVWLLASTFRGGTDGQCDYGRVELVNGRTRARLN